MLTVYHGSVCPVPKPLAQVGRPNLDFGQGFYVTDLHAQAVAWATRAANQGRPQWLSSYLFDKERAIASYRYLFFPAYNEDWLDFIVKSRLGERPWLDYDWIEGGVADDRVIDTVNLYMLDIIPMELAIRRLAQHQPNNQLCLLNQALIEECLSFVQAEPLNDKSRNGRSKNED